MSATESAGWKKTSCILCSVNCGLEVQTDGGRIARIRGDKAHPISQGYVCEKSQRLDYFQNSADRLDRPMGTFGVVDQSVTYDACQPRTRSQTTHNQGQAA